VRSSVLNLFKRAESRFVEAVHPIICNGEVTTDAFRSIEQAEPSLDLVDDAVPLVDADSKSQVPELGSQCALFSSPRGRSTRCRGILPSSKGRMPNISLYKLEKH